jgi:hypothetical protein
MRGGHDNKSLSTPAVIPAQAGIQALGWPHPLDARPHGHDTNSTSALAVIPAHPIERSAANRVSSPAPGFRGGAPLFISLPERSAAMRAEHRGKILFIHARFVGQPQHIRRNTGGRAVFFPTVEIHIFLRRMKFDYSPPHVVAKRKPCFSMLQGKNYSLSL